MKSILITAFVLYSLCARAQSVTSELTSDRPTSILLGKISEESLLEPPFRDWYQKNYEAYSPDQNTIDNFSEALKAYSITVFMGSWCGDSKREVPTFFKILHQADFPMSALTLVAVDRAPDSYKQSPGGEQEGLNIHRVPTFIFNKNGKEVGRISERPVVSMENDILSMLKGEYIPRYAGVTTVDNLLKENGAENFLEIAKARLPKLKEQLEHRYELNTYAKVLVSLNKMPEAIAVFELNTLLFPEDTGTFLSLANTLGIAGDKERAISNYRKVLQLDPKNREAISGINFLNSKI